MDKKYCLFYGTLREGEYNYNRILGAFGEDSLKPIKTLDVPNYSMFSLDAYPAAIWNPKSEIPLVCDLMQVSEEAVEAIHQMEIGAGYRRYTLDVHTEIENVEVTVKATIWLFPHGYNIMSKNYALIECGDWVKHNSIELEEYEHKD